MAEALWKVDCDLEEAMKKYVSQSLQRREMLDFLIRDFPEYTWSLRSLDRRLRHFDIFYKDEDVGPGKLLGYRAMRAMHCLEHTQDQSSKGDNFAQWYSKPHIWFSRGV